MLRKTVSTTLVVSIMCCWGPALAAPATVEAASSTGEFELRLGEALAATQFASSSLRTAAGGSIELESSVTAYPTEASTSQVALLSQRPIDLARHTLQETAESAPTPTPPAKKNGSWLKRHWYVPVLIAVVIYVAAEESEDNIRDNLNQ